MMVMPLGREIFYPRNLSNQHLWFVDQDRQMLRANPIMLSLIIHGDKGDFVTGSLTLCASSFMV